MKTALTALLALGLAGCAAQTQGADTEDTTTPAAETTAAETTPAETPAPAAPDADAPQPPPQIAGGFAPASDEAPDLAAAREMAVNEVYRRHPTRALVASAEAELQVVAGLNYRFHIVMTGEAAPAYDVTIHRNLQGELSVLSFETAAK